MAGSGLASQPVKSAPAITTDIRREAAADLAALHAVIANRHDVLACYRTSPKRIYTEENCRALAAIFAMRDELAALWERSSASKEQLLRQLQDWCSRAEASGIAALVDFRADVARTP